ncbi:MAG: S1 RNA-binding domain-containing protein [Ruminococcaceae bacterium]|nr:S1 RNA-binding domain-containing protein [Oscillospiraceae bacterium]
MSTQPNVGEIVEGKITGITKFGVFVDISEGVTGMVHISEVARTYVNEIRDFVKEGDSVKVKVLSINEEGKISLSIKRAQEDEKPERPRRQAKQVTPPKPDNSFVWTTTKNEGGSFEDMMNKFKQTSDEKFSDLKRKNVEVRRPKRGAAK